jgi:hypothetical protein
MKISLQPISDDPDTPEGDITYFGCVDGFDSAHGISGWVLNAAAPDTPVALELLVDGAAMPGVTISRAPRDELAVYFPAQFETAGFVLSLRGWERFKTLAEIRPQADFTIKIAGTNFILPRAFGVPGLATIVAAAAKSDQTQLDLFSRLSQLSKRIAPARG